MTDNMSFEQVEAKIVEWATQRGIIPDGQQNAARTKLCKTFEELGELAHAELRNDSAEILDAVGDTVVTLVIYSHMKGFKLSEATGVAYNVIASRSGKVVNGIFIRDK